MEGNSLILFVCKERIIYPIFELLMFELEADDDGEEEEFIFSIPYIWKYFLKN